MTSLPGRYSRSKQFPHFPFEWLLFCQMQFRLECFSRELGNWQPISAPHHLECTQECRIYTTKKGNLTLKLASPEKIEIQEYRAVVGSGIFIHWSLVIKAACGLVIKCSLFCSILSVSFLFCIAALFLKMFSLPLILPVRVVTLCCALAKQDAVIFFDQVVDISATFKA